ncbi:MAG: phosphatidylserine/phosphatidylglycerophosphate/cardiolipin synthase family protein [Candidatus Eisenbacteria bacterium]|nr:phosphatidylserine/phosphatidylglycerophosphate/cardiolipin synthase family protein [Candidatus Eisenbacteria bacterium]
MRMQILVDSQEFCESLRHDLLSSRDYSFIQTLSFEGDSAGKMLASLLLSSKCADKRILVDSFTKFRLSDKLVYSPKNLFNSKLRREVRETTGMIEHLRKSGIGMRFTNPNGPLFMRAAARNHKKLLVLDDRVAYVGGINFSEHNFYWHDMMLRIEDQGVAEFLKEDFLSTWNGHNLNASRRFEGVEFHLLDGVSNEASFMPILGLLRNSKRRIWVESPYLTFPFSRILRELRSNGVSVTIVTPEENNEKLLKECLLWESARSDFDLRLYKGRMTHLKAILIDDDFLLVGSANFDYLSYHSQQEVVAVVSDPDVIQSFKERIVSKDLENSSVFDGKVNGLKGNLIHLGLRSLGKLATSLGKL